MWRTVARPVRTLWPGRPKLPTARAGQHAALPAPLSDRRAVSADFESAIDAAFGGFGSRSDIASGSL